MQTQFIKRTCDFCKESYVFPQNRELNSAESSEMGRWLTVIREVVKDGQIVPVVAHYCRPGCGVNGLKLASDIALTDAQLPGETAPGSGLIVGQ